MWHTRCAALACRTRRPLPPPSARQAALHPPSRSLCSWARSTSLTSQRRSHSRAASQACCMSTRSSSPAYCGGAPSGRSRRQRTSCRACVRCARLTGLRCRLLLGMPSWAGHAPVVLLLLLGALCKQALLASARALQPFVNHASHRHAKARPRDASGKFLRWAASRAAGCVALTTAPRCLPGLRRNMG